MQRRMRDGKEEKKEVEEEECQLKDQKLNANDPWMMEASYSKYTITHTHTHAHGSLAVLQAQSQIIDYFMTMCQVQ